MKAKCFLLLILCAMLCIAPVMAAVTQTNDTTTIPGQVIVIFNGTGSTTWNLPEGVSSIWYLVVAGGGSGGYNHGGGGGAGGLINGTWNVNLSSGIPVVVGSGGNNNTEIGNNGTSSSFGLISTIGGGGGGGSTATIAGKHGGSGGGGNVPAAGTIAGGSGTPGQGNAGGIGYRLGGGGGGGAGAAGENGGIDGTNYGGDGGNGTSINITGTPTYYAGGGGGVGWGETIFGSGGLGGGGTGGYYASVGTDGTNGLGGGGGAGGTGSGKGGSGVVILQYTTPHVNNFYSNVTYGTATLGVQFNGSVSSLVANADTYEWSFGDLTSNSTDQNPTHSYSSNGTYDVILTTTNTTYGLTATTQKANYIQVGTMDFLPGYYTRISHDLTGNITWGSDLTNYQVYLNVYKESGISTGGTVYLNNTSVRFPLDLNFTNSNGTTTLPYWLDGTVGNATYQRAAVNVSSVYASSAPKRIFIYTNSSSVLSQSNGSTTFPFFDDAAMWNKVGPVISPSQAWETNSINEISVIYDTTPQILTGYTNVYKAIYRSGTGTGTFSLGYAESENGINWTKYTGNPVLGIANWTPSFFKNESTYYIYDIPGDGSSIRCWNSTNGINWTFNSTALTLGAHGQWDHTFFANTAHWFDTSDNKWHMLYEAKNDDTSVIWNVGHATADNPWGNWTKDVNNPVMLDAANPSPPVKVGNTWYTWSGLGHVENIYRWSTTNLSADWTKTTNAAIARTSIREGWNATNGALGDPYITTSQNGEVFLYYTAGIDAGGAGDGDEIHLAYSNLNYTQIVATLEDSTALDTNKWVSSGGTTVSGSVINQTGLAGSWNYYLYGKYQFGPNTSVVASAWFRSTSDYSDIKLYSGATPNVTQNYIDLIYAGGAKLRAYSNPFVTAPTTNLDTNPHVYEIRWTPTNVSAYKDGINMTGSPITNTSYIPLNTDFNISYHNNGANIISSDYTYIRKYNNPEPLDSTYGAIETTEPVVVTPVANFTANTTTGTSPLNVSFTDSSTNTPTSWYWEFGDGNTSTTQSPTHLYYTGNWSVNMSATNAAGTDWKNGTYINVTSGVVAPVASFTSNLTIGKAPLTIQFTDGSTNTPTSWLWQWGDGTANTTTQSPVHTFTAVGVYQVNLTATNSAGSNKSANTAITAQALVPPVAGFSANATTGYPGDSFLFTDSSTESPTSWEWYFGDSTANATTQNPVHTYSNVGTYSVTLTATNADGSDSYMRSNYITISTVPTPPTAAFSGTPTTGTVPQTVTFTDASTNSPTDWLWQFGDSNTSTTQSPTHTYYTAGTYDVKLYVENGDGNDWENKTGYLVFTNPATPTPTPTPATQAPACSFRSNITGAPSYPCTVQFNQTCTGNPTSFNWSFGDGTTSTEENPNHTYTDQGYFTVYLNATNAFGTGETQKENYFHIIQHYVRPTVSTTIAPIGTRGYGMILDSFGGNKSPANETEAKTNWTMLAFGSVAPFMDTLGPLFPLLIIAIPFILIWLATRDLTLPCIVGILICPFLIVMLPSQWHIIAAIGIGLGITAVIYTILTRRE